MLEHFLPLNFLSCAGLLMVTKSHDATLSCRATSPIREVLGSRRAQLVASWGKWPRCRPRARERH